MENLAIAQALVLNNLLFDEEEEYHNYYDDDINECLMFLARNSMKIRRTPRLKNYTEEVISAYSDEQFQLQFRMQRSTFNYILELIKPILMRSKPGHKMISPEKQFLIGIWKMATSDSYRAICEKFNVARATASASVRRVIEAIGSLAPRFLTWPEGERVEQIFQGFETNSTFPKVIGAIDTTFINIKVPKQNPQCYVDRKGGHSIKLQAVCDHERRFIHCEAGHVGSVHDQRVFRLSDVNNYLNDPQKFPNDCHLVGDSSYTIHENLMTPYRDDGNLSEKQKNYNLCHASARITIEQAFGLLKGRFRSLLSVLDMERVDLIPNFIIACCVLHNICLMQNDELLIEDLEMIEVDDEIQVMPHWRMDRNAGNTKRDTICDNLIMRTA